MTTVTRAVFQNTIAGLTGLFPRCDAKFATLNVINCFHFKDAHRANVLSSWQKGLNVLNDSKWRKHYHELCELTKIRFARFAKIHCEDKTLIK